MSFLKKSCILLAVNVSFASAGFGGTSNSWKQHIDEQFETNNKTIFRTAGQVEWRAGFVSLGDKGRLVFPVDIGKRFYGPKWKLHLRIAGELHSSAATLSVRFHMGRDAARVQFHAAKQDGRLVESIRIMEETQYALPYTVREESVAVTGARAPFQGAWVVAYNHGLVTVQRNGKTLLIGSVHLPGGVEPATTPLFQIEIAQSAGRWRCDELRFASIAAQFTPAKHRNGELRANRLERKATVLASSRQWYEALTAAQDVLRFRRKSLGQKHYATAKAMHQLGVTLHHLGRYREARKMFQAALPIWRDVTGEDHPVSLRTIIALAKTLHQIGGHSKHFAALEGAYRLAQTVYGGIHPTTADILFQLGQWHAARNDVARAKQLHQEAYTIRKRLRLLRAAGSWPKTDRRKMLMDSLIALAALDLRSNDAAAAETKYFQVAATRKQKYGVNAPIVAKSKRPLAALAKLRGLWLLAEQYDRSVLLVYQQEFGREHPETASAMIDLAETLFRKPKPTPSETTEAAALLRTGLGTQQAWLARVGSAPMIPTRSACVAAHRRGLDAAIALAANGKCSGELAYRYMFLGKHMPELVNQWLHTVRTSPRAKKDVEQMGRASHLLSLMAYEPFRPMVLAEFPVLAAEIELLQQRLSRKTPIPWGKSAINLKSLQKSLPENTALLDFTTYTQRKPDTIVNATETRLAGFFVTGQRVECIDFGPTNTIAALNEKPQELRSLLLKAIRKHIGSTKLFFVAPNAVTASIPSTSFTNELVIATLLPQSKVASQMLKAIRHPYPSVWSTWMTAGFQTGNSENVAKSAAAAPALRTKGFPIIPAGVAIVAAGLIVIGVGVMRRRRRTT